MAIFQWRIVEVGDMLLVISCAIYGGMKFDVLLIFDDILAKMQNVKYGVL